MRPSSAILLLALIAFACGDSPTGQGNGGAAPTPLSVSGSWEIVDVNNGAAAKVTIPVLPNARTGWVLEVTEKLCFGQPAVDTLIISDRTTLDLSGGNFEMFVLEADVCFSLADGQPLGGGESLSRPHGGYEVEVNQAGQTLIRTGEWTAVATDSSLGQAMRLDLGYDVGVTLHFERK